MSLAGGLASLVVGSVLLACHALALRCLPGATGAPRWSAALALRVTGLGLREPLAPPGNPAVRARAAP